MKITCPKCGLETFADQKFCRYCGARMQFTTQQLLKPEAIADLGRISTIGAKGGHERANHFVLWGFISMLIGVAIGVVGKKLLYEEVITVIGVLISLLGMFLVVFPYLSPSRRKENDLSQSPQQRVLTSPERTKYLREASDIEYVPTVTERTTDLLENSPGHVREADTGRSLET